MKNIEYMQADILDLRKLNQQFDIIESIGAFITWKIQWLVGPCYQRF